MRRNLVYSVHLLVFMALASVGSTAWPASLGALAVAVRNESEPVLCAEKDNVALSFTHSSVRSFRIEAAHPVYLSQLRRDSQEADWTACDMSQDPIYKAPIPPRKVILYRDPNLWVIGFTYPTFWRPANTEVRIGSRVEKNLHMLQVWMRQGRRAEEVLVLYPPDGYWRARPFSPPGFRGTAYGSSFLVGPIEQATRPVVNIDWVHFDPKSKRFTLAFRQGGQGTVTLVDADTFKQTLDVVLERPVKSQPFAMLRSMYITEFNNDVARVAVREAQARGWREVNVMQFDQAEATDLWAGRLVPSQHNTSAPDMVFNGFSDGDVPKVPRRSPPRAPSKT